MTSTFNRRAEDLASASIMATASCLSLAGLIFLLAQALVEPDARLVLSAAVYGSTLFLAFMASALYHGLRSPDAKAFFYALDHCTIHLLIAGSYTPIALLALYESGGIFLLIIVWSLAALSIAIRLLWIRQLHRYTTLIYLLQGWIGLAWIVPLIENLDLASLLLLLSGGLLYSGGVAFFLWSRLPFNNAVWHGFVFSGALCHYLAIAFFIAPDYSASLLH